MAFRQDYTGASRQLVGLSLPVLPVDILHCVFSFLGRDDLARFSTISRAGRSVATQDRLWQPLLAKHFKAVMPLTKWGPTPARQFSAIALSPCSVCQKPVLPLQELGSRYPGVHSCEKEGCEELCCAACHCQCSCLRRHCKLDRDEDNLDLSVFMCACCRAWCHSDCNEQSIISCDACLVTFCSYCMDQCESCPFSYCDSCRVMSYCDACKQTFCGACLSNGWCEACNSFFCSHCRDECGHSLDSEGHLPSIACLYLHTEEREFEFNRVRLRARSISFEHELAS
jgi:hypothetical protein